MQLKTKDIKRVREEILEEQNGLCAICGKPPKRACLDHHHKKRIGGTGKIRGVVCSNCNVFLAKSENNSIRYGIKPEELPNILRNIADYLEKEQYNMIHPSEAPPDPHLTKRSYNKLKSLYNEKKKFPEYPRSGKITKQLKAIFERYSVEPEFYKR